MSFYKLSKEERKQLVSEIHSAIENDVDKKEYKQIQNYFSDSDTYIRKAAYQSVGKIYKRKKELRKQIISLLQFLLLSNDQNIRQTAINAAGEIGMDDFEPIGALMDKGLFDPHHSVRNAVIGSMKKMGEKNPRPVLEFAKKYLHHPDKEIRREICHGIELRGRTHPEDILPLLKELQFDKTSRVRNTLVHVIGQIAYKKGCLEKVVEDLKTWENKDLVKDALDEIVDVHERYKDFAVKNQKEAIEYIGKSIEGGNAPSH